MEIAASPGGATDCVACFPPPLPGLALLLTEIRWFAVAAAT